MSWNINLFLVIWHYEHWQVYIIIILKFRNNLIRTPLAIIFQSRVLQQGYNLCLWLWNLFAIALLYLDESFDDYGRFFLCPWLQYWWVNQNKDLIVCCIWLLYHVCILDSMVILKFPIHSTNSMSALYFISCMYLRVYIYYKFPVHSTNLMSSVFVISCI